MTHDARKRTYEGDDEDEDPYAEEPTTQEQKNRRDQGAEFPPQHLKVPPCFYEFKKQVEKNYCYVCSGFGHHGFKCPYLMAYFHVSPEGQAFLADQGLMIPADILNVRREKIEVYRLIHIQLKHPARLAANLTHRWFTKDLPCTTPEDLGDYEDKASMAREIGAHRNWEILPWRHTYEQFLKRQNELEARRTAGTTVVPKHPPPPLDPVVPGTTTPSTQTTTTTQVPKPKPAPPPQFQTRPGYKVLRPPAPTFEDEVKDVKSKDSKDLDFDMAD